MASPFPLATEFAPIDRTLPQMLTRQAARHGDKALLHIGDATLSFNAMRDLAAISAGLLHEAGITRGDRVAVMISNRIELLQLLLGCGWLGAVLVPINTASRGVALQHILDNSGATLLVVEQSFSGNLAGLDLSRITRLWSIESADGDAVAGSIAMPKHATPLPAAAIHPADMLAILYTSGTTGPAKGVCCPHAQFFWWGVNSSALLGLQPDDVLCTTLPLFHTNALNTFFQALLNGISVHYETRFSASGFWDTLRKHHATVTYLLGAMVPILLSKPADQTERDHKVRIALAPGVPAQFQQVFKDRSGIGLLEGYGSTETNFVIGTTLAHQKPGSMGTVFTGFEAKVVDAFDEPVPDGEPGELVLRADEPFAFATGYFAMPDKTVEAWRNLWFHTGDRVIRDPDGSFRFVDRLKDAIRRRGENISSFEVEQVLLSHPAVANAAVFPVQSDLGEDEVMAAIVLRPGESLDPLSLIHYCEPRLAYFAVPRFIDIVDHLPATENGKVQKFKLRERGVNASTWDREASGYQLKRR